MPDDETPPAPEDGAPAPEPPREHSDARSNGWASPAANLPTPIEPAEGGPTPARRFPPEPQVYRPAALRPEPPTPAEPRPEPRVEPAASSGGWFSRLRSFVQRGDAGGAPPVPSAAAPWRSPSAADERVTLPASPTPPTPRFEAPARPSLSDPTPVIEGAHAETTPPPASTDIEAPTATPSPAPGAAWRFGQFGAATPPAPVPIDAAPEVASEPDPPIEASDAPHLDAAVAEDTPAEAPATLEAPAETNPETDATNDAQPSLSLFHTQPAEPQPVIEDLEPLPSLEVIAQAIEDALQEAVSVIEQPPTETPEDAEFPPVPPLTVIAEDLPLVDPDAESPEEEAEEQREAELIAKGGPFSRFAWPSHPHYWNGFLAVITVLTTLSFLMFVLVEPSPRWILVVVALGVAAGMDGVLRATWRAAFARGEDTTPYLFLPALYVFAAPLLIEHNVTGHTVLAWALLAGLGFGAIAVAEVLSVRTGSPLYRYARMVTTGAAYFAAFSLLAMTYVLNLGVVPAFIATWFIGTMLAIEVVREGEVDPVETAVFAGLVGLVLSQVRWLLFYLPLDGYLAGLALVLVFYFVTGVLHSYVLRQLNRITAVEYALVTTIGMVLVGAARAAGLA